MIAKIHIAQYGITRGIIRSPIADGLRRAAAEYFIRNAYNLTSRIRVERLRRDK